MPKSGEIVLTTGRMVLRRFTMDGVESLADLDADPDVMRYLSRESPTRDEVATVFLPALIAHYERGSVVGRFAASDRETGDFIGWFALDGLPREPELGYRLKRAYWGAGLATEGARALIDLAFRQGETARIRAQTTAINTGSRRVMEKLGMQHLRTFHEHFDDPLPGTQHGEVEYAITREEWQAGKSSRHDPGV